MARGVFARSGLDKKIGDAMVAGINVAAVAAQFSIVQLFNNSERGHYLWLRWTQVLTPSSTQNVLYQRNHGQIAGLGGTAQAPVNPQIGRLPGLVNGGTAASVPGDFPMFISTDAIGLWEWRLNGPFAIIPPGWSFFFSAAVANVGLGASFLWTTGEPSH